MKVDISDLTKKLDDLTGLDFEECENEERLTGTRSVDVTFSKSFQARLAARALGVNPFEIKELPLKQYARVTTQVMSFLFSDLGKEETPPNLLDKQQ